MGDISPNHAIDNEPSFEHSIPSFVVNDRNRRDSLDDEGGCVPGCLPGLNSGRSMRKMEALSGETGLSVKEIRALRERFSKIAPRGHMSREQFKQTLGMLGMTPNDYIPNRMFSVFDSNGDNTLTFEEYLRAFAILLRGSEEARLNLSFRLADASGTGALSYEDFKALVEACQSTSMAILESNTTGLITEPEIRDLFHDISSPPHTSISLPDYMQAVRTNGKFLAIIGLTGTVTGSRVNMRPASQSPPSSPNALDELKRLKADLAKLKRDLQDGSEGSPLESIQRLISKYEKPQVSPLAVGSKPTSRPASPQPILNRPSSIESHNVKGHRMLGPKKGMAVHFGHENWNMVLSMMIGIRLAVGRASFEINRPLTSVDFFVKDKFSIVPQLSNILDSKISSSIKVTRFIDYAPLVFRKLREEISDISEADYTRSVGPEQLLGNMVLGNLSSLAEQTTEGKGGAFFYYTADGRFMIKTVTRDEKHLLKNMLRDYYAYLSKNKDSFIVRFYGLHGLRLKRDPLLFQQGKYRRDEKIFFVVMGNLFNTPLEVHRRFDLKGSWVGRSSGNAPSLDTTIALRDNDFVERKEVINVGSSAKQVICDQLRKDADFFASRNIIDYSLLLGIHDRRIATEGVSVDSFEEETGQARSFPSTDGTCVYYLGVIDILCEYNTKKRLENVFKSIRYDSRGISAVPPKDYADRFYSFICDHIR
jgi:1-phosphatidylinositol-4-phosphate 5-kinase